MKYGKIYEGDLIIKAGDENDYSEVEEITGDLSIHSNAKLEALQSVGGYLSIYSNTKLEASNLQSVGGSLYIYSNAKLEALQSVGGYLSIHSGAKLEASNLQSVGGYLSIYSNAKLEASNLQSVGGDSSIHSNAKLEALQSVGGDLYIHSGAKLEALQSVGGDLYIDSGAKLEASNLQSVGGYLSIYSNAKLEASNLQSVGGDSSIHSNAKLEASNLQSVGGDLYIDSGAKLEAPNAKFNVEGTRKFALEFNFNCFLNMGFLFADRILAKIIKKKTNNTNTVYKVQICGQTKVSYCVEYTNPDGSKTFAHGETIKQAKKDLKYKFKEIDTSMYKDYTLDTVVTFEDAIQMYHAITGACSLGTKHFCENVLKVKKKKYTIAECIELTRGQYNSEKFEEFFKCQK